MASITQVNGKWRALVRRKGFPSYCKTFAVKAQALAWATKIEASLDEGVSPGAEVVRDRRFTVSELIREYRKLMEQTRPILDTSNSHYMLKTLDLHLGQLDAQRLSVDDLVGFALVRKEEGAGPYTVNMDVSKLGTVMRYTGSFLRLQLPDVVGMSRPVLKHMGLIGSGGRRERRPQEDELARILAWLTDNKGKVYADFVYFAALTAMRRSEVCGLLWADLDEKKRLVLIRQRKDPRSKKTNDQWVPLLGETWDVAKAQPVIEGEPRIFSVHPQTVSKYFKEAREALEIPDLKLHDMRHEGTSRLFEDGYAIQEVALVTGHKKWETLKRYTNLRPEDLHRKKEQK
ncbi:site-specific integrase [Comamonas odontotermitis]|uniref:site-specific integrase n=1 Tax=Comamonas odontotermitis TaxID=379895 RepID=UPI001CC5F172|nr:site-specific integrase [Comamonas odontotermitis]UBB19532.1 site-specific integrase [Comamonas odontotermitis]